MKLVDVTADSTATCTCRPGFFKHDSRAVIRPSPFSHNHEAMEEINKSSAFLRLFISQEVSIFSVNSFHAHSYRIVS